MAVATLLIGTLFSYFELLLNPTTNLVWYRVRWSGVPFMVEAFSLMAVGTSLIGTLLAFSEFFKEQLKNLPMNSPSTQLSEVD